MMSQKSKYTCLTELTTAIMQFIEKTLSGCNDNMEYDTNAIFSHF